MLFAKEQPARPSESKEDVCARAWQQFESQFPTEEDCWRELYRRLEADGQAKCCHCGSKDLDGNFAARVRKCRGCKKKTWLTAGTFFNRMRSAKPWLAAIWLMEQGVVISSLKLHKLAGIAQSSALAILKKVAMVIQSHFGDDAATVPSGHFRPVFCKRSRLTPARGHPVKEQEEMERNVQNTADLSKLLEAGQTNLLTICDGPDSNVDRLIELSSREMTTENEFEGREKEIYELLSGEPILFDALCELTEMSVSELSSTLTMMEIAGAVERLPGERYVRHVSRQIGRKSLCATTLQTTNAVSDFINFVRLQFHGISRKYVQLYLAVHWCQLARRRWNNDSLMLACLRFGCITYDEILKYVSPLMVTCAPDET